MYKGLLLERGRVQLQLPRDQLFAPLKTAKFCVSFGTVGRALGSRRRRWRMR